MMATHSSKFANVTITPSRVFYQRDHVFAMSVHNSILPGHVVLCLRQPDVRYSEISTHQLFDLTLAIKELTDVIYLNFTAPAQSGSKSTISANPPSTSIIVQEPDQHGHLNQMHVHLIPRRHNHNLTNEQLFQQISLFGQS